MDESTTSPHQPVIAAKAPMVMELEPGTYYYCRCGRSKTQPFCDGAHAGTEFTPQEFKVEAKRRMALCLCKHTENEPRCDASHNRL